MFNVRLGFNAKNMEDVLYVCTEVAKAIKVCENNEAKIHNNELLCEYEPHKEKKILVGGMACYSKREEKDESNKPV